MAKRFTDTEKWKRDWFLGLTPTEKVFWSYLCDTCSPAGIWAVSWRSAEFHVGAKLDRAKIEKTFSKQIVLLDSGRKWFIVDFITFQYKHLNANNPAHKGAIEELQRYSLLANDLSILLPINTLEVPTEELQSPSLGAKDKDTIKGMDKGMDKVEAKETFGEFGNVRLTATEHQKLIERFGDMTANAAIENYSAAVKSKGLKYKDDYATICNWIRRDQERGNNGTGNRNSTQGRTRQSPSANDLREVAAAAKRMLDQTRPGE